MRMAHIRGVARGIMHMCSPSKFLCMRDYCSDMYLNKKLEGSLTVKLPGYRSQLLLLSEKYSSETFFR